MYDFSIILPSRNAPNQFLKCIKSIFTNADHPEKIELIIILDKDNCYKYKEPLEYINYISYVITLNHPESINNIRIFTVDQNPDLNNTYYNIPAKYTSGKYLFGPSDNLVIFLKHYDTFLSEKIEEFLLNKPDRIFYMVYNDYCGCPNFICWPIITRETFNVLNGLIPKELKHSGVDIALYQIFDRLKQIGYNRLLQIPKFTFFNNNPDEVPEHIIDYYKFRDINKFIQNKIVRYKTNMTDEEIDSYLFKFKNYIDIKNNE